MITRPSDESSSAYNSLAQADLVVLLRTLGILAMKSDLDYMPNLEEVLPCGGIADTGSR